MADTKDILEEAKEEIRLFDEEDPHPYFPSALIEKLTAEVERLRDVTGEDKTLEELDAELLAQGIDMRKAHKNLMNILDLKIETESLKTELEQLRSFGKDDNCLDCGRRAHLKENDTMLCASCHNRRIEHKEQIESLTTELEQCRKELASARPGWCPICHERVYNKVKAENDTLKQKLQESEAKVKEVE